jgi:glycosyltransferase involved in cell wall biosynthesis
VGDLIKEKIQLFHGLSNELPVNLNKSGIRSVVTIHDLIFLTHPQYYKLIDRTIYKKKFGYSASISDAIIAVSLRTKEDIVNSLGISQDKIFVVYQGCNPIFNTEKSEEEKVQVRRKYGLPKEFLLCVGTIEERKNQLAIVKAMKQGKIDIPLILVGKSTFYSSEINKYIEREMIGKVKMLNNVAASDLPSIYQMASVFIYPSLIEGFGIPVLEAILSKIPVITSRGRSMEEAGGKAAIYINPEDIDEIAQAIRNCAEDSGLRTRLINEGTKHSLNFTDQSIADNIMQVYNRLF